MLDSIRTIVAGVAAPASDDPTLVAAATLARWTGAALHLVEAFTIPPLFSSPELGYTSTEWGLHHAEHRRAELAAVARRVPGAESATCHALAGPPAHAILETAEREGAGLVVVGAASPDRLGGSFLGTTAQRVLRGAGVPVLVVRAPVHRPLRRVLTTTDLGEPSAAVHEAGLDAAAAIFGQPVSVRSLLALSVPMGASLLQPLLLEQTALEQLEAFLRARRRRRHPVEPVVRLGAPAEEIVAEAAAWPADLLIVGTHARGWAARLVLGSVAEAALRDAPCNVLAVPPRAVALTRSPAEGAAEARRPAPAPEPVLHVDRHHPLSTVTEQTAPA
ncbi:MAG TPA: universal stress protein [Longimicrobium sp.]